MVKKMNSFMLLIVLAVVISSFSQILLKKSTKVEHSSFIKEYLNKEVIIGYLMMFVSTILTLLAYHFGVEYKNGPIIESLGYVLIMVLSLLFFKEKITKRKLIGNILILIGIVVFYL